VPNSWFLANSPLSCTLDTDTSTITCPHFAPLADTFGLKGTVTGIDGATEDSPLDKFTVIVITPDDFATNKEPNGGTTGPRALCGQQGIGVTPDEKFYTTPQRMYDCSKRIGNFAGYGNGNSTFTNFAPGNQSSIDKIWFLVSCSDDCIAKSEDGFWLSPVMTSSNPAVGPDQFDSNGVAMSTYADGRMLWSGVSAGTMNFFVANGSNPRDTGDASYDYYKTINTNTMSTQQNATGTPDINGPLIYNPDSPNTPKLTSGSTEWGSVTYSGSICSGNGSGAPTLLSGTQYDWQMPSYPMVMTLTGGDSSGNYCETGSGFTFNRKALCNGGNLKLGFRAIDPIPSFQTRRIWSSSVEDSNRGWGFDGPDDGQVDNDLLSDPRAVRCVSPVSDL